MNSTTRRSALSILVVMAALLAACTWSAPPASAAPPTDGQTASRAIGALVESMESKVIAGDIGGYLGLVDLRDPVFAVEHTRWANRWGTHPPTRFQLSIRSILANGTGATGKLSISWRAGDEKTRRATLDVRFTQDQAGSWLYAGERWITESVDHFVVNVAPGLESELPAIVSSLPEVYEHATTEIGYVPEATMHIKLYPGAAELVATTRLDLPDIHGWNEPGESLKLRLDPEFPSLTPFIAHEFTHFAAFDRAGTQRTRMPWWLDEGLASFVGYHFEGPELGEFQLSRVQTWAVNHELVEWSRMAVFEETPEAFYPHVYAQGYVFVRYITEIYGKDARNAWVAAMATEMDLEAATQAELGLAFSQLDEDFVEWLLAVPATQ